MGRTRQAEGSKLQMVLLHQRLSGRKVQQKGQDSGLAGRKTAG
jgi:hypothetical protein